MEARCEMLIEALKQSIPKKQIIPFAPMREYTTLKLGGPADVLVSVSSVEEITAALSAARAQDVPVTVIGNGSNLLVRDGGIRGLVIHVGDGFSAVSAPVPLPDGRYAITAQGGATLTKLSNAAADNALAGLEFACGIPGTVGGAVFMNAGAYGGEIKDVAVKTLYLDAAGELREAVGEAHDFSYRHSRFQPGEIVLSCDFLLQPGDENEIQAKMSELAAKRKASQPLELPSAGSTFKRPAGGYAAALIDQAGLKGLTVGGAQVSTKHAGFVVNIGGASCADVLALMEKIKEAVLAASGIELEPEVRIVK